MDFDFLSSNLHIAYPFRESVTVTRPSGSVDIDGLVAAIRVYTYDQSEDVLFLDEADLRSSDGFATLDAAKLTLRWATAYAQFTLEDGVNAAAKVSTYGAWIVVRWRHLTEDFVFHMIFPAAVAEEDGSSSSSSSSAGPTLTFRFWKELDDIEILSSIVKQGPGKVKRVFVKTGDTLQQVAGPDAELLVRPGFNMELSPGAAEESDVGRKLTRVAINAVPVAGTGKYLICPGNEYLLTLNGVGPDDVGNTKLAPEECYWLDVPIASGPTPLFPQQHNIARTAVLTPNEVRLRNACGPCCSCEDYIKTYEHLRSIWDRAKTAANRVDELRTDYCALVDRLTAKLPQDDILFLSQTGQTFTAQVAIWNNVLGPEGFPIDITDPITVKLTIAMETGSWYLLMGVLTGFGSPQYPTIYDKLTTPNIITDEDIYPYQIAYWNVMFSASGIDVGDVITVTAEIGGGMEKAETETLTWASLGG